MNASTLGNGLARYQRSRIPIRWLAQTLADPDVVHRYSGSRSQLQAARTDERHGESSLSRSIAFVMMMIAIREVAYDVDGLSMVGHLAQPDGEGLGRRCL